ncbi:FkbM family methyltransferase [Alphaproteobacteria bacterium]|nr:FkbM family methyltransferase [bacterium]MDC0148548.1 FkbM family methyltransferase [Alphaproteobacteria bacterium]MDC1241050.1 FkbM family methyltransferase [bacterium]
MQSDDQRKANAHAAQPPNAEAMERDPQALAFHENGEYKVDYQDIELGGHTYFLPNYAIQRPAVRRFLNGRYHEPEMHRLVEKFFQKVSGSMIHAGTFFGDMLPSFSQNVSGTVYAFEPVLENFVLAKLTVEKNNLSNVILNNCALSDKFTNLKINTTEVGHKHAGGSSKIADSGSICAAVPIDILKDEEIVLLHLDIEGHELAALKGAIRTLKKCRPVVVIEDRKKNCAPFLERRDYQAIAHFPDLTIWVPTENETYRRTIIGAVG